MYRDEQQAARNLAPLAYDLSGAATALSSTPGEVHGFIRRGLITPVRVGKKLLIQAEELQRFLLERRGAPSPMSRGSQSRGPRGRFESRSASGRASDNRDQESA